MWRREPEGNSGRQLNFCFLVALVASSFLPLTLVHILFKLSQQFQWLVKDPAQLSCVHVALLLLFMVSFHPLFCDIWSPLKPYCLIQKCWKNELNLYVLPNASASFPPQSTTRNHRVGCPTTISLKCTIFLKPWWQLYFLLCTLQTAYYCSCDI